jgi:hypothetical protein
MAGHLLTLREGLSAMRYQPVLNSEQLLAGLNDTLIILEKYWGKTRQPVCDCCASTA